MSLKKVSTAVALACCVALSGTAVQAAGGMDNTGNARANTTSKARLAKEMGQLNAAPSVTKTATTGTAATKAAASVKASQPAPVIKAATSVKAAPATPSTVKSNIASATATTSTVKNNTAPAAPARATTATSAAAPKQVATPHVAKPSRPAGVNLAAKPSNNQASGTGKATNNAKTAQAGRDAQQNVSDKEKRDQVRESYANAKYDRASKNNAAEKLNKDKTSKQNSKNKKNAKNAKNAHEQLTPAVPAKPMFGGVELPENYKDISIFGEAVATKAQAVNFIKANNPNQKLACSIEMLVNYYWDEAKREGVRPDLALCQAIVETGFFRYGGDVYHNQNNFCGLGTTGKGVRGATFKTPTLGVRAHIQHLLAYSEAKRPSTPIVDPRYDIAHQVRLNRGFINKWSGLNGTWAMGANYCEKIMMQYQKMLAAPGAKPKLAPVNKKDKHKTNIKDRIGHILYDDRD